MRSFSILIPSLMFICAVPALAQKKVYTVNHLKTVDPKSTKLYNISYREEIVIDEVNKQLVIRQYSNKNPDHYYKIASVSKSKTDKNKTTYQVYDLLDDDSKLYFAIYLDTFFHKIKFQMDEQNYMVYGYK